MTPLQPRFRTMGRLPRGKAGWGMKPLALTMGDPAGIGGELTLRAWLALRRPARASSRWTIRSGWPACRSSKSRSPDEAAAIFADALPVLPVRLAAAPPARAARHGERAGGDRLDRTRRVALPARRGRRHGDQPDQQGGAVPRRLRLSRPHRVPRRTDRRARQADHDAGQPASARRAGDRARLAAQLDRHADDRADRRRRAHHGRGAAARFRHRAAAPGDRRAQPACRRAGRAGRRGDHHHRARHRRAARRGDRRLRPVAARHDVHARRRARATMWRSACTTTRR